MSRSALLAAATAAVTGVVLGFPAPSHAGADRVVGHVYEPTNSATGNAVAVFDRHADGSLTSAEQVATGGHGTGAPLGSQNAIVRDGNLLFVVNAGDDTVSSLSASGRRLRLRDRISTRGDRPVSVTVHEGVGYVLNHDSDTISGFRYDGSGHLRRLRSSIRQLTPNPAGGLTDAAQVQFTPAGRRLFVTEKAANTIDTFAVRHGRARGARPHPSAGTVPYGFDIDVHGTLVVSEAATGSTSSYRIGPRFHNVTPALSDTQAAACWLVVSRGVAWVVNAASDSVSSYRIHRDGSLELLAAVAATTRPGPTDAAVAPDGGQLFVRVGDGSVTSFRIGRGGSLTPTGSAAGPADHGIAGLAAD